MSTLVKMGFIRVATQLVTHLKGWNHYISLLAFSELIFIFIDIL